MAAPTARKPLPALIFLVALSLLSALVWWRVLHRSSSAHAQTTSTTCVSSSAPAPAVSVVPAPSAVSVKVLNSTQKQGLAGATAASLAQLGFMINGPAGNDPTPVAGVADIRYGPTGHSAATLLSFYVPGATLVQDTRKDGSVDLSLGAQFTSLATAADATKAMTAAHVTQQQASGTPTGSVKPSTSPSASTPRASGSTRPAGC
ncbi:MAG: LytR C-terminal domain-containing protein [Actinobacteria bacterium]|nr:LytR C-terminal domain-containing protein [Actinomycetota bacterium]